MQSAGLYNRVNYAGLRGAKSRLLTCFLVVVLLGVLSGGLHGQDASAVTLTHVEGRVMVRRAAGAGMEFPNIGRVFAADEVVITGDQARVELRVGDKGLWRVGRRAVFLPNATGGRLTAGAALVRVPAEAGWRVESGRGAVLLGKGLWMLQAVDNEGLKLVCLDGPASVDALGEGGLSASDGDVRVRLNLRPGELTFLRKRIWSDRDRLSGGAAGHEPVGECVSRATGGVAPFAKPGVRPTRAA
jgi:hypothetical protein